MILEDDIVVNNLLVLVCLIKRKKKVLYTPLLPFPFIKLAHVNGVLECSA